MGQWKGYLGSETSDTVATSVILPLRYAALGVSMRGKAKDVPDVSQMRE